MHSERTPLVSVVLIFLNQERFLEEAIQSVRAQTLTDWELILVDDGSTDGSTRLARGIAADDDRIRYFEHPRHANRGTGVSRNFGVAQGTGRYVAFIDGDDVWVPSKLAEQVELLEQMPDVAMTCGAVLAWWSWDPAATEIDVLQLVVGAADRRIDPPDAALATYPLGRGETVGPDMLVRRTAYEAVGGCEERFGTIFEDQSLCMKIFLRYPVYVSSRVWFRYRQHSNSCCAQYDDLGWLQVQKVFLDWLDEYIGPHDGTAVGDALRRAQRDLVHQRLRARVRRMRRAVKRIALRGN